MSYPVLLLQLSRNLVKLIALQAPLQARPHAFETRISAAGSALPLLYPLPLRIDAVALQKSPCCRLYQRAASTVVCLV